MMSLDGLRSGLIVSVQAWPGSAIDDPQVIAAMAQAAAQNGAVGVRVAGVAHLRAVRARVQTPIIGIIKREYAGFAPYITPTLDDVAAIADCGAEIVAFDATRRRRPGDLSTDVLVAAIHRRGALAMADCATFDDMRAARADGADIVATTLCGYTDETKGQSLPALALVRRAAELGTFVICEGGVKAPAQVREALDAGADAVVVGTAITNVDWLVREFAVPTTKSPR